MNFQVNNVGTYEAVRVAKLAKSSPTNSCQKISEIMFFSTKEFLWPSVTDEQLCILYTFLSPPQNQLESLKEERRIIKI